MLVLQGQRPTSGVVPAGCFVSFEDVGESASSQQGGAIQALAVGLLDGLEEELMGLRAVGQPGEIGRVVGAGRRRDRALQVEQVGEEDEAGPLQEGLRVGEAGFEDGLHEGQASVGSGGDLGSQQIADHGPERFSLFHGGQKDQPGSSRMVVAKAGGQESIAAERAEVGGVRDDGDFGVELEGPDVVADLSVVAPSAVSMVAMAS